MPFPHPPYTVMTHRTTPSISFSSTQGRKVVVDLFTGPHCTLSPEDCVKPMTRSGGHTSFAGSSEPSPHTNSSESDTG